MVRRITLICAALAALVGVGTFYFRTLPNNDNPVPEAFRKSIGDAELAAASGKRRSANVAKQFEGLTPAKNSIRLAVGNLGSVDRSADGKLADLMLHDLGSVPGISLVERAEIERVLQEQGLSATGLQRASDAVRCGHILGVDWFLLATRFSASGTNYLAARIVDAEDSAIVDAAVLPVGLTVAETAGNLGTFVRGTWANRQSEIRRTYLAVGAMENLSLNESQADFGAKLRSDVAAHNRAKNVTILERDQIEPLYQELLLDMAGLTEDSQTRRPMLSALCLVSGAYQTLDDGKIEVVLDINQITALHHERMVFSDKPEFLLTQINNAITEQLKQHANAISWTRHSEADAQLDLGMSLVQQGHKLAFNQTYHQSFPSWNIEDSQLIGTERKLRHHNLAEAIKAFEAVLVLQPTNQEAKCCMAECLENPVMNQIEKARELYREVVDENPRKESASQAKTRLLMSFNGPWPTVKAAWYQEAATKCSNPDAKSYFQEQAEGASKYVENLNHRNDALPVDATTFSKATSNLLANLKRPNYALCSAVDTFAGEFGTNTVAAAKAATDVLPELEGLYPDRRLELRASVVAVQADINAPIVSEFRETLKSLMAQPKAMEHPDDFWREVRDDLRRWCYRKGCLDLAEVIVNQELQTRAPGARYFDDQKLVLGLESYRFHNWTNALRILQTYSNCPVELGSSLRTEDGLSLFYGTILTEPYVMECEKHLNLTHVRDAREFDIGSAFADLDEQGNFDADENGVWVAQYSRLRHLRADGSIDYAFPLPIPKDTAVNCVLHCDDCLWLGTAGLGLLQVSKADGTCKRFTTENGLLMNSVRRLARKGDTWWSGYGDN